MRNSFLYNTIFKIKYKFFAKNVIKYICHNNYITHDHDFKF